MIVPRLLVVDPDLEVGKLYEERFRKVGYIVIYTNNPKMALELARALAPDMVLLDPGFPGDAGKTLLNELLAAKETAHIPVIVTAEGFIHNQLKEAAKGQVSEAADKESDAILSRIDSYFESVGLLFAESLERQKKAEEAKKYFEEEAKESEEEPRPRREIMAEKLQTLPEPKEEEAAPRYKIALIADDPFFVRLYETKLPQAGFIVSSSPNPDLPADFLMQFKPHVIVTTDKFKEEIFMIHKGTGEKPAVIDIIPEGKTCPPELTDFRGSCLVQENLNPAKLIAEIDTVMSKPLPQKV